MTECDKNCMSIEDCRAQQNECSDKVRQRQDAIRAALEAKIDGVQSALAAEIKELSRVTFLIAGRFGIRVNGSSGVDERPMEHKRDGEHESHLHARIADLQQQLADARKATPVPSTDEVRLPRWAAAGIAIAFAMSGIAVILMYQTRVDLEMIAKAGKILVP